MEALVSVWGGNRVAVRIAPVGRWNGMSDSDPDALFDYVATRRCLRVLPTACDPLAIASKSRLVRTNPARSSVLDYFLLADNRSKATTGIFGDTNPKACFRFSSSVRTLVDFIQKSGAVACKGSALL
jgi:hypothetical protein